MAVVVNHQGRRTIDGVGTFDHGEHQVSDEVAVKLVGVPGFGYGDDTDEGPWECSDHDKPKVYKTRSGYDRHMESHTE